MYSTKFKILIPICSVPLRYLYRFDINVKITHCFLLKLSPGFLCLLELGFWKQKLQSVDINSYAIKISAF